MSERIALFMKNFFGGGAERVVLSLAHGMADRGLKVDLVVCQARGPLYDQLQDNVRCIDLDVSRVLAGTVPLSRYLRQESPQALIAALSATNCVAVWARALARTPVKLVLTEHSTLSVFTKNASSKRDKMLPVLMRRTYPKADKIIAVSRGAADDLADVLNLERRRIAVIHNPVVSAEMLQKSYETVEDPWILDDSFPVILSAGRLTKAKGFDDLIQAFSIMRRYKKAKLIILGEGRERAHLEARARELGLESDVSMPGHVQNPYAYMRNADLFVLSSHWEGFANVLVEAMACGTRVVSTDCPSGPAELLEEGQWGEMVPVGDVVAFASAMDKSLDAANSLDPSERGLYFSVERAVDDYMVTMGLG